ncbi:MAG: BRCT domain-containing protein [Pseudomonadota bacterium]
MDIYSRFNHNSILDRQIDTLIGLSKGITANGAVDQAEADYLQTWLVQNSHTDNIIIKNLLHKVNEMLADKILDAEESLELLALLHKITGDDCELGELTKTSHLPLSTPVPEIHFMDKTFLFTGTFAFGNRKLCQEKVIALGGKNVPRVTKQLDYLVLGVYSTDSWKHENFGRKIEKAMEYNDKGSSIAIVSEEHWLSFIDN